MTINTWAYIYGRFTLDPHRSEWGEKTGGHRARIMCHKEDILFCKPRQERQRLRSIYSLPSERTSLEIHLFLRINVSLSLKSPWESGASLKCSRRLFLARSRTAGMLLFCQTFFLCSSTPISHLSRFVLCSLRFICVWFAVERSKLRVYHVKPTRIDR